MEMTVNILGETQKEQWLNAIGIYYMVISSNIDAAYAHVNGQGTDPDYADEYASERLLAAERVLGEFKDEMQRLVEGVFNDD